MMCLEDFYSSDKTFFLFFCVCPTLCVSRLVIENLDPLSWWGLQEIPLPHEPMFWAKFSDPRVGPLRGIFKIFWCAPLVRPSGVSPDPCVTPLGRDSTSVRVEDFLVAEKGQALTTYFWGKGGSEKMFRKKFEKIPKTLPSISYWSLNSCYCCS